MIKLCGITITTGINIFISSSYLSPYVLYNTSDIDHTGKAATFNVRDENAQNHVRLLHKSI